MERPLSPPASDSRLMNGATLVLVCLGLYLPLFWQLPLLRSEAMYALIPQEMLAAGSWLTPTLNGAPYLDKPHLLYWLNLLGYKLLGVSEWSARVPTLAMTVGEVWLTYLIGRRLVGRIAAWLGGFILLTCIGFFVLHLHDSHRSPGHPVPAGGVIWSAALGGPAGLPLDGPVLSGPGGRVSQQGFHRARLSRLDRPPLCLARAGAPSPAAVLLSRGAHPGSHAPGCLGLGDGVGQSRLSQVPDRQRTDHAVPGPAEPPDVNSFTLAGFYVFLGIWLMPWTFILPEALYRFWQATRPGREVGAAGRLLLIWAAVILGFFTLSSSRIEYYSLPALPALALILGWRIKRYLDTPGDRLIPWTLLALGLLGLSLLVLLPYLEQVCVDNRREFSGMVSLIAPLARQATWFIPAVALAGVLAARLRRPRLAVAAYGVLAVAIAWFTFQTMIVLTPLLCDKAAGEYVRRVASPRTCSSWGPSKSLNTGPPWNITPGAISSWSSATACPSFLTRCPPPRTTSSPRNACRSCGRDPEKSFCSWTTPPRRSLSSKTPPRP